MAHPLFITGIDIGSSSIRAVTGTDSLGKGQSFSIIGVSESASSGITKGSITSIDEAVSSLSACLEGLERMVGAPIENAYVGIANTSIQSIPTKGVIAVSRPDGEIREEDVDRAIDAAQAVATPPNSETLHVIPRSFTVDQQGGIKDPLGMNGIRLEVEAKIIQGMSSQVRNVTKAIFRTGIDIDDLVFSILASAEGALSMRQKELGVAIVDIGSSLTAMAVFEEGDLLTTAVIPIGGNHITSDIAIGLRTSLEVAERIKLEYGQCESEEVGKRDEIELGDFSEQEHGKTSLRQVVEIIGARVEEIFEFIDKELTKIGKSGMLPAGIVIVGGAAKLPGMIEVAKRVCRLPSSMGFPVNVPCVIDKVQDPAFAAAVGLVAWGRTLSLSRNEGSFHFASLSSLKGATGTVGKWFKSLLP